ncbi:MAG: NAD(P)/FAD-dependent oxidoreductase [Spirochaetes bacterium]|nr:NAD(P)/FAD-dependent oxidoreductase [Spirochaetota bacterium]
MSHHDLVIIGSGPAGHAAAFEAVKHGMKTAIVERDPTRLGGVCLGEGCIPLKGLLYHSHFSRDYTEIRDLVMKRVGSLREGLRKRLSGLGVEIIPGEGRFVSEKELMVGERALGASSYLIATGSHPRRLFNQPNVLTSEGIFNMEGVPARALIIGGGVVGCEYASFLAAMGSAVDIVEALESPLYGEDEEAVRAMVREFKKRKIGVYGGCLVREILPGNDVIMSAGAGERREKYDLIFETTGRSPSTAGIGLDAAGVRLSEKGYITVNDAMRTTNSAVYAAGDCIDTPMLAYTAAREAETAVRHMAGAGVPPIDYGAMPRLVFSIPQVGSVGITEKEAREKNLDFRVYKYFFKALGKAVVEGRDAGFIKLIEDAETGKLLGAAVVGDEAADIMNQLALIVKTGIRCCEVLDSMFVHPSYSEIIAEALLHGRH